MTYFPVVAQQGFHIPLTYNPLIPVITHIQKIIFLDIALLSCNIQNIAASGNFEENRSFCLVRVLGSRKTKL